MKVNVLQDIYLNELNSLFQKVDEKRRVSRTNTYYVEDLINYLQCDFSEKGSP